MKFDWSFVSLCLGLLVIVAATAATGAVASMVVLEWLF